MKRYEGIVLRDPNCKHIRKRHIGFIKAKTNQTFDLKIIGFIPEYPFVYFIRLFISFFLFDWNRKGPLTQFVLSSANNKTVKVGNGILDHTKEHIEKNKQSYIGRIVEISCSSVSGRKLY